MTPVSDTLRRILAALTKARTLPSCTLPGYIAALSGALAVTAFLGLPIVKVSFLGHDITRTGSQLIQATFASSEWLQISFSVALTLALVTAGLGSLLFLGSRHRHGSILGGTSLVVLISLGVYLVIREEGPKLIAIGLWLSVLLLVVMSTSTLLASALSRPPRRRDDREGD
jgi:hypothetical protein